MSLVVVQTAETYPPRTRMCIIESDIAVNFDSPGENLTRKQVYSCRLWYFIYKSSWVLILQNPIILQSKLILLETRLLGFDQDEYVLSILRGIIDCYDTVQIVYGGQSGVDLAGARAGFGLGLETKVIMPKGFMYRTEKNKDTTQSFEEAQKRITRL